METLRKYISYLPVFSLLLLVASLPFQYGTFQRISLYAIAVTIPLDYILNQRWRQWKWTSKHWVYVAFILFFCLIPLRQLFDPLQTFLFPYTIERYLPFLVIGALGIMGITDKIRIEYVGWTMLLVSCAIILYAMCSIDIQSITSMREWIHRFNALCHHHFNTHMVLNLYWNMALVLALNIIGRRRNSWGMRIVTIILVLPIIFSLFITDGRTGIITCTLIMLIFLIYKMIKHRYWWLTIIALIFMAIASFSIMQHDRFVAATQETNPRIYIWNVALQMIAEKPILGYGLCTARDQFVQRGLNDKDFYDNYVADLIYEMNMRHDKVRLEIMHPHNAILETWTQLGLIGVILLLACWILPFTMKLGREQFYLNLCVFAFLLQAQFESMGNNLQPMYFCLIVLLFHSHVLGRRAERISLHH